MILVRKVDLRRWTTPCAGIPDDEVPAGELTSKKSILQADNNELSFWRFDPKSPNWECDAALTVTGKTLEGVHIMWIAESDVIAAGLTPTPSAGDTQFPPCSGFHVDLVELGSLKLSTVARLMKGAVGAGNTRSFTIEELIRLFQTASAERRVRVDSLYNEWKLKLKATTPT